MIDAMDRLYKAMIPYLRRLRDKTFRDNEEIDSRLDAKIAPFNSPVDGEDKSPSSSTGEDKSPSPSTGKAGMG